GPRSDEQPPLTLRSATSSMTPSAVWSAKRRANASRCAYPPTEMLESTVALLRERSPKHCLWTCDVDAGRHRAGRCDPRRSCAASRHLARGWVYVGVRGWRVQSLRLLRFALAPRCLLKVSVLARFEASLQGQRGPGAGAEGESEEPAVPAQHPRYP